MWARRGRGSPFFRTLTRSTARTLSNALLLLILSDARVSDHPYTFFESFQRPRLSPQISPQSTKMEALFEKFLG